MGRPVYKNVIYKITNLVNGKVYIGQTTQGFLQRRREHICRFNRGERDHRIYLAFKKYGFDSFSWEVICQTTDASLLNTLEQFFIRKYNSYLKGYNCNEGGFSVSEETRRKISETQRANDLRGERHPNYRNGQRTERKREMQSWQYRDWRTAIFVRDGYQCQMCGVKGSYFHADHIVAWKADESLRYDVANGRT